MALLDVDGLRRSFGGVSALDGASLSVEAGTITGLIGPNGAGKTTLFNVVTGHIPPMGGRVTFDGHDVTGWRADRLARAGLTRTFQIARGLAELTVIENLMLYAHDQPGEALTRALLGGRAVRDREAAVLEEAWRVAKRLEIDKVANQRAADLSGGQKKLLELGRALMAAPKLVLLDEPAAGVNPSLTRRLAEHIQSLRAHGLTFLIVEHNMGMIAELCDHVVVLAEGKRLAEGRFEDVRADERVQTAYLGSRH